MTGNSSLYAASQPQILQAVTNLWERAFNTEDEAFNSGHFRILNHVCSSVYSKIPGSRLPNSPPDDFSRRELSEALRHFFRWTGAPWYREKYSITAEDATGRLHAALLMTRIQRTYLAPLDQLGFADTTEQPRKDLRQIRFGDCEIVLLDDDHLGRLVYIDSLRRFEQRYWLPLDRLSGFHYLLVREEELAGPIGRRGSLAWLHELSGKSMSDIDRFNVYDPIYSKTVEDALFVVLLFLTVKATDASKNAEKPFAVPWVYSFTNDLFAEPSHAPDPSLLSWSIEGDENYQNEVPDRSNNYEFTKAEVEEALTKRWQLLRSASAADASRNFHPLTKHFFVKAFSEHGIDEIVSLISCVEATLMLSDEKSTKPLLKRYKNLVNDCGEYKSLKLAYAIRNKYLHALGDLRETATLNDMTKYRRAVAKTVDGYLALTETRKSEIREALLKSLRP